MLEQHLPGAAADLLDHGQPLTGLAPLQCDYPLHGHRIPRYQRAAIVFQRLMHAGAIVGSSAALVLHGLEHVQVLELAGASLEG